MRFKRKLILAAAAAVGPLTSFALATDRSWNGANSNLWAASANWTAGIAPATNENAVFMAQAGVARSLVIFDSDRTIAGMVIDGTPAVGAYEFQKQNNALLTSTGELLIGFGGAATPVTFNGFNVTASNLAVAGTLTTIGGAIDTATQQISAEAGGVINIGASTLICNSLFIDANNSRININSGGVLQYSGFNIFAGGTLTLNSGGTLNIGADQLKTDGSAFIQFNRTFSLAAGKTISIKQAGDLASTDFVDIGALGDGTLLVDGLGSSVNIGSGAAAYTDWGNNAHTATINFSTSGTGEFNRGLRIAGSGSFTTARVNINSNANLKVDTFLFTGGTNNAASITINAATLASTGTSFFGNGTTISLQTSGVLAFSDNATFSTGSNLNWSGGTMTIPSGKSINVAGGSINNTLGGIELGNGVTLNITNIGGTGGQFANNRFFDIANGNATGTMHVDGANSIVTTGGSITSDWGASAGNSATVTFSNSGAGTYNGLRMSAFGGTTRLTLSSAGQLNIGSLTTGRTTTGSNASITIGGGMLNIMGAASFLSGTNINLSTGTLALGGISTFSTGATLTQTGGTFAIPGNSTLTFEGGGTGSITSNAIPSGTTVRVVSGGKLNVGNYLDIANTVATGTLLVDGGTSSFAIVSSNSSSLWGNGGGNTADVTVSNGATADLSGIFFLEVAPSASKARINLLTGGKMNIHGLRTGDPGGGAATITVDAAALTTTGTVLFNSGALVKLQNSGSINFNGGATFSTGSTLNWSSGNLNIANGNTLAINGATASFTGVSPQVQNNTTFSIGANGLLQTDAAILIGSAGIGRVIVDGAGAKLISNPIFGQSVIGGGITTGGTLKIADGGAATFTAGVSGGINSLAGGGEITVGPNGGSLTASAMQLGSATAVPSQLDLVNGTVNILGNATFSGGSSVLYQAGSLNVGGNLTTSNTASISLFSNAVLRTHGLTMTETSSIDLEPGGLIDDYTGGSPLSTVRGYLLAGRNGGLWKGAGIKSTTAAGDPVHYGVGIAEASAIGSPATFMGQPIDSTSVLVRMTFNGDSNLDGQVDISDLYALASHWQQSAGVWTSGDFNYDGLVNAVDLGMLSRNWQQGISNPLGSEAFQQALTALGLGGASVPEPATVGVAVCGMLFATMRRRPRIALSDSK